MKTLTTTLAASLTAASLCSQTPEALLFTTLDDERTACAKPQSLEEVEPNDVMSVRPGTTQPPCAAKFAPYDAWLTLAGDTDGDSQIWEATSGKIDALLWQPTCTDSNMRGLYFSTSVDIEDCVNQNGTPQRFRDGDVARIRADGQFEFFLREEQIRSAFRIPINIDIDVDAIAADCDRPIVYLSLEDDTWVFTQNAGVIMARDGAVLAIPVIACGEPCTVQPLSGLLVMPEARVDQLVQNSGVRDRNGALPAAIDDLDGLHLDEGTFQNQWGAWNNLYFCGETLTGGAVLSTQPRGGTPGSIATMNGARLADHTAPTTGARVGLRSSPLDPGSLNGLECRAAETVCTFVLETSTPQVTPGGTLDILVNNTDLGIVIILAHVKIDQPCYAHPMLAPWSNPGFPEIIDFLLPLPAVPIGPNGFGQLQLTVNPNTPPIDVVLQGVTFDGATFKFSTPMTIEVD